MARLYKSIFTERGTITESFEVAPKNGKDFSLEELKEFVGGYIEVLGLGDKYMVVNEEGKLLGMPLNPLATAIIHQNGYYDVIVGNALVCDSSEIK